MFLHVFHSISGDVLKCLGFFYHYVHFSCAVVILQSTGGVAGSEKKFSFPFLKQQKEEKLKGGREVFKTSCHLPKLKLLA